MLKTAFIGVFKNKSYLTVAAGVAIVVFAFAVWLPNLSLLFSIITDSTIPVSIKLTFPLHLLTSITTNFTVLSASYTIAIALLTGINIALITNYVQIQREYVSKAGMTAGSLGIISGVFGLGCAACGSLILTSILGTAGGASLITLLPLKGSEFGILGVTLLLVSTYLLAKQITKPLVCDPSN